MEGATQYLRYILVMLGSRHKERLGAGIGIGLVIQFIYLLLVATEKLPAVSNIVSVPGCIALGVSLTFIPLWLDPKQRHIGEEEQRILAFMDELIRRGGLTAAQRKIAYNHMLQKQIEHYYPGKPLELEKDAKEAIEEAALDKRQE